MLDLASTVLDELRSVARTELDFHKPIELSHALQRDLALDSVSMVVVAVALENRFRVRLDEQDAGALATVRDLVNLVCRRVSEQHPGRPAGAT